MLRRAHGPPKYPRVTVAGFDPLDHMTTDTLIRMQLEVITGKAWGDPGTEVPQTPENHAAWDRMAEELRDMEAKGIVAEIPFELDI